MASCVGVDFCRGRTNRASNFALVDKLPSNLMRFVTSLWIGQNLPYCCGVTCSLLLAMGLAQAQTAHPLENWRTNAPAEPGHQLFEAAYGAGRWVAVGNVRIHSTNAVQWTVDELQNQALYMVFWDGTAFVAGGKSGLNNQPSLLYVSANGTDWGTPQSILYGDTNGIYAGTVGGSTKLLVGENGLVIRNGGAGWQRNRAGDGNQPVGNLYGNLCKSILNETGGGLIGSA